MLEAVVILSVIDASRRIGIRMLLNLERLDGSTVFGTGSIWWERKWVER